MWAYGLIINTKRIMAFCFFFIRPEQIFIPMYYLTQLPVMSVLLFLFFHKLFSFRSDIFIYRLRNKKEKERNCSRREGRKTCICTDVCTRMDVYVLINVYIFYSATYICSSFSVFFSGPILCLADSFHKIYSIAYCYVLIFVLVSMTSFDVRKVKDMHSYCFCLIIFSINHDVMQLNRNSL